MPTDPLRDERVGASLEACSDEELFKLVKKVGHELWLRARRGNKSTAGFTMALEDGSVVLATVGHELETKEFETLHQLAKVADGGGSPFYFSGKRDSFDDLARVCQKMLGARPAHLSPADRAANSERIAADLAHVFPFRFAWCIPLLEGRAAHEVRALGTEIKERMRSAFAHILELAADAQWKGGATARKLVREGARQLGVSKRLVKDAFFDAKKKNARRRERKSAGQ